MEKVKTYQVIEVIKTNISFDEFFETFGECKGQHTYVKVDPDDWEEYEADNILKELKEMGVDLSLPVLFLIWW